MFAFCSSVEQFAEERYFLMMDGDIYVFERLQWRYYCKAFLNMRQCNDSNVWYATHGSLGIKKFL